MRIYTAFAAAGILALGAPAVLAADAAGSARAAQKSGPLKPGRSAGVHAAQLPRTGLALIGASAIIAVVVVAVGTGSSGNGNAPESNFQSVSTTAP